MFKRVVLTAAVALTIVAVSASHAQQGPKHQLKKILKELDLSDEQKQEVRELMQQGRANMSVYKSDLVSLMQELKGYIQSSEWNEDNALSAIQQRQDLKNQAGYQKALAKQQLWQILDETQQAEFETLMEEGVLGGKGKHKDAFKRIGLSDEQKAQIEAIRTSAQTSSEEIKASVQAFKIAEQNLIKTGELSEANWQALADQYQTSFEQLALTKAYARHQMWNVLDDEQQQTVEERMSKMRERMEKRFSEAPDEV